MPLFNSVLGRYTPPTCTLEILGRTSPLYRWVGRPVTTLLGFQLRFDDSRLPEQQWVTIQGDREQLQALHEAVTTYVQDLLNQSPDRFNALVSGLPPSSPNAAVSSTPTELDLSVHNSQALSKAPRPLDFSDASAHLDPEENAPKPTAAPFGIFLQPSRGLAHNLFLGPLATQESGLFIRLSVLQLFDLASALDEYATDVVHLPALSRSRLASAPPTWAGIAAILLLGVGLITLVVQVLKWTSQEQTATTTAPEGSSSKNPPQIALQPSPLPTLSTPIPPLSSPSPSPTLSTPIPPLPSPLEKLPSLPPLSSSIPSPSSSLPSSVTSPRTSTARKRPPSETLPRTTADLPSAPQLLAPPTPPVNVIPPPPPPIITSPAPMPDSEQKSSTLPQLTPANPDLDAAPSLPTRGGARTPESSKKPPADAERDSAALPDLPGTHLSNRNPFLEGVPFGGKQTETRSTPTTPNQPKSTAANIPQLAEARNYFKQHWQPPSGLTQNLEYNLLLDVDGTIQRIEPLGQAARTYVDRTGIPLVGEHFVSPLQTGQAPLIRVVLSPDGKVQTFLASN